MNLEQLLAEAQVVMNNHATSSATGLCLSCGIPGPCPHREWAVVAFSRSLRLPVRIPGLTQPERVNPTPVQPKRATP
jgi:hypothetical protein